jgi:hypothetical protein
MPVGLIINRVEKTESESQAQSMAQGQINS